MKTIKQLKSEIKEIKELEVKNMKEETSWIEYVKLISMLPLKEKKALLQQTEEILKLINLPIRTDRFFNKCKKCGQPYETTDTYRKGFAKLQRELKKKIEGK